MSDLELDRMVSAASLVSDREIASLDLDSAVSELIGEIVSLPTDTKATEVETGSRFRRSRKKLLVGLTAVAAVGLVAAGIITTTSMRKPQFGAMARAVAESNPRILPGTPGWKVLRADEFTVTQGEMTFGKGSQTVDVHWEPADQHRYQLGKAHEEGQDVTEVEVFGKTATMFRYEGTTDYVAVLPPQGPNYVYIRGDLGSEDAFREILSELRTVDVNTWLEAMPDNVVRPDDRAATVDEMLSDMAIPAGLNVEKLRSEKGVKDRYQLGAQVAGAVACGWLDIWSDAKEAGDSAKVEQAVTAMRASHNWRVLNQMNEEGDYPEEVWQISDAMIAPTEINGLDVSSREWFEPALGCWFANEYYEDPIAEPES